LGLDIIARIRGERQTIGVDIGHFSIKVVRVHHGRGGFRRVMNIDLERTPDGAIVDNEVKDEPKLKEALIRVMTRSFADISKDDIVASVNWSAGILVDKSTAKVPKNGNEDAIIVQTAQTKPPFDDQDIVLDYQVVSRGDAGEVKSLVVAAKNTVLESKARLFVDSGYRLDAIDVDVFGVANAYVSTVSEEQLGETVALFNLGEKKSTIAFIVGGKFHSARTLTSGSMETVEAMLSRHLGIDALKCHELFEKPDTNIDGFSVAEVESAMQLAFEEVVNSVEFGIRYFSTSESGEKPARILLCGGGASLPGLCDYLKQKTDIECATLNPFARIPCDPIVAGTAGVPEALSNLYAPALGLALRKF